MIPKKSIKKIDPPFFKDAFLFGIAYGCLINIFSLFEMYRVISSEPIGTAWETLWLSVVFPFGICFLSIPIVFYTVRKYIKRNAPLTFHLSKGALIGIATGLGFTFASMFVAYIWVKFGDPSFGQQISAYSLDSTKLFLERNGTPLEEIEEMVSGMQVMFEYANTFTGLVQGAVFSSFGYMFVHALVGIGSIKWFQSK